MRRGLITLTVTQLRLRRCQSGYRHAWRRATHVVQTCAVTEVDRGRVSGVFAADTEFEIRLCGTPAVDCEVDELAYAVLIETGEGVLVIDFFALVLVIEQTHVVAA